MGLGRVFSSPVMCVLGRGFSCEKVMAEKVWLDEFWRKKFCGVVLALVRFFDFSENLYIFF